MTIVSWRNATLALAVLCIGQRYAACTRHRAPAAASTDDDAGAPAHERPFLPPAASLIVPAVAAMPPRTAAAKPMMFHGIKIPTAIAQLLPQPGEKLRAYRDRVLPLAETAIGPQRARVARIRDELSLSPAQRTALDANITTAATAIENRVLAGIASGEIDPHGATPMGGIAVARDVLDTVDRGNTQFQASLSADQRAALGTLHFDYADYLMFSAPWEDALHVLD